jgi:hypothetical protein
VRYGQRFINLDNLHMLNSLYLIKNESKSSNHRLNLCYLHVSNLLYFIKRENKSSNHRLSLILEQLDFAVIKSQNTAFTQLQCTLIAVLELSEVTMYFMDVARCTLIAVLELSDITVYFVDVA